MKHNTIRRRPKSMSHSTDITIKALIHWGTRDCISSISVSAWFESVLTEESRPLWSTSPSSIAYFVIITNYFTLTKVFVEEFARSGYYP